MNEDEDRHIREIEVFDLTATEKYEMTLNEFIEWIIDTVKTTVPNEFLDSVRIKGTIEYGQCDSYTTVAASYKRPETDEEMLGRIATTLRRKEQNELRERNEYNRLKDKYGNR